MSLETGQWLIYTRTLVRINYAFGVAPMFVAFAVWLAARRFFTYFPCEKLKEKLFNELVITADGDCDGA